MNLNPPPFGGTHEELLSWCNELYEFLKYPHFHAIRFIKRTTPPESAEGVTYLDDDDDKLKVHNGTDFQDCY
jgi:hypothetical protein